MTRGKLCLAAALAVSAVGTFGATSAVAATVTLGRAELQGLAPTEFFECSACQSFSAATLATAGGAQPVVPADGTVTSWAALGKAQEATAAMFALRPQPGGTLTFGEITSPTTTLDGTQLPSSLPVLAGDRLGLSFLRTVEFAKSKVSIGVAPAAGASWAELTYYQPGNVAETFPTAGAELLYNATVQLLAPALTGLSPAGGGAGTAVTIRGSHLAIATGVTFGGMPAASFSGNDEQITAVAPAHAPGPVDVQVTTAGGTSGAAPLDVFTYPTAPPPPDRTAPTLAALLVSPSSFKAANIGGSVIAARVGAHIAYRTSEAATVTFTVQRILPGRIRAHRCLAPTRRHPGGRRCTRLKALKGNFTRNSPAGTDLFSFTGRLGGRALAPGRYRLSAVAQDAAGNRSKASAQSFRIVR